MKKLLYPVLAGFMALSLVLVGCGGGETSKGQVELVYVNWACAEAETYVAATVLEDMGYDVEKIMVDAGVMWSSVATGDADAFTTAWLPFTHEAYLEQYGDQVDRLGPIGEGAKIGLVVPTYVTISSCDELADHADEFDRRIVGIDPGAGIMRHTEEDAMPAYGIEDWELVTGSDAAMMAELDRSIQNEEWIVITGWTPHWMFFAYDLKYLDDPALAYGGSETIEAIARKGLREDMPEVAQFLENMYFTLDQLHEVIYMINVEGIPPEEAARQWVDENQDVVNTWIP